MVRIGEVPGDPDGIAVSTTGRLVRVWAGMEWTDLEPEAASGWPRCWSGRPSWRGARDEPAGD